jgi:hypothetical protein
MFLARIVFFRLHESPRYLVHAGRPQEALVSLRMISRFNGSNLTIDLDDVDDHRPPTRSLLDDDDEVLTPFILNGREETHFHAHDRNGHDDAEIPTTLTADQEVQDAALRASSTIQTVRGQADVIDYLSMRDSPTQLPADLHSRAVSSERANLISPIISGNSTPPQDIPSDQTSSRVALPFLSSHSASRGSPRSEPPRNRNSGSPLVGHSRIADLLAERRLVDALPRWMHKPLRGWLDRLGMVLSPVWFKTTILVWSAWCAMALGVYPFMNCCLDIECNVTSSIYDVQRLPP